MSKYGVLSGPYFVLFGLNIKIYRVSICIESKYGKIWTRKNTEFGNFSSSFLPTLKLWEERDKSLQKLPRKREIRSCRWGEEVILNTEKAKNAIFSYTVNSYNFRGNINLEIEECFLSWVILHIFAEDFNVYFYQYLWSKLFRYDCLKLQFGYYMLFYMCYMLTVILVTWV